MSSLRIHRYISREISVPVVLSLLIFTFVLLMGRIPKLTELVVSKGVPSREIIQLFSYLMPTFFSITMPLSFLLGILLAFGRLSADSEFIALKASGVSLYALLKPVLLMGLCFSLLTGWLTIIVEPASKSAFRSKLFQIASSRASVGVQPGIFNDNFDGLVLYTRGMDERQGIMEGVFISDEREGETPATIVAKQGRFIPDPKNYSLTLRLSNGTIHRQPTGKKKATYQTVGFSTYDINLDLASQLADEKQRHRSRGELSWSELNEAYDAADNEKAKYRFAVEKHKRVAIAFAPMVFALVGVPLGLQSNRSGKGAGFAMALAIALVYYLLLSVASTLAGKGALPASVALWLPNFCFLFGGSYFLHRTAIEQPMSFFSWPARLLGQLKHLISGKERP
ncbi:LPS export ABC transporter permease LptF [Malonomonas rubra]|uniref:LPS export ABC transporter permease LptF n=1 Tax=Malonomonas rubra TaxID=57040 RepID=UPI0026EBE33A|nr:LPS export ABC transporter permease LptF [Malonomonas rubra]